MGLLDIFKRKDTGVTAGKDLFDDEFQRKLDYLMVAARRLFAGRLRADRRTKKTGSGIEFADHREYTIGDEIRSIDWKVYARSEKLLLRLFEEEEDLSIYILIDSSLSMSVGDPPKFDHARKLAAAMAYVGLGSLDRVAMIAWSTEVARQVPSTRGKQRIFRFFEFLRSLKPAGETALADVARVFASQHKRRGLAIIISDLYDPEGFERGINAIRYQKYEPIVIHVVDPKEADPGQRGDITLFDVETNELREVTLTAPMVTAYKKAHDAWKKQIEDFCKTRQVPYVQADTSQPFEEQVLRLFRKMAILT